MKLRPALGPVQLTFYSVGVIVGAGVYSVIGAAAGLAGESLWLSFVVGAIVAALTALSYAEMTTAFPTAGAEYVYVRRALPETRWISTLTAAINDLRQRGKTIVLITHRTAVIGVTTKLLLLRDGVGEMYGPTNQVLQALQEKAQKQLQAQGQRPAQPQPQPQAQAPSQAPQVPPQQPAAAPEAPATNAPATTQEGE